MEKLQPGLYASEDGAEVVLVRPLFGGELKVVRFAIPGDLGTQWLMPEEIMHRWPLRVVRCEVER